MTTPRTRLYLDVDGVINAQMPNGWGRLQKGHATARSEDAVPQGGWADPRDTATYRITWAPNMITALSELDLELVWCTTWRDSAPASIAPLIGWESAETARVLHPASGNTTFPSIDWKLDAVLAEQRDDPSPFVWIDDEINDLYAGAREATEHLNGLLIAPDHTLGITPKHIEQIAAFIEAQRDNAA